MQTHNTMRRKEPLQVVAEQQQQQRVGEGSLSTFAVATNDTPTYRSVPEVKLFGRARAAGVLVLLVSAVTVATLAYQLLSCNEEQGFRKQVSSKINRV
jgi:hypothetical protein